MSGHAPPFYCPYCGEEDIRPGGSAPGQWTCGACLRAWGLRFLGIDGAALADPADGNGSAGPAEADATVGASR